MYLVIGAFGIPRCLPLPRSTLLQNVLHFIIFSMSNRPQKPPFSMSVSGKIFYFVFTEMQMYGPRDESRTVPWAKCQIFFETFFICNVIDKNLNKNFHSHLGYHSFELLFLCFQIRAIRST